MDTYDPGHKTRDIEEYCLKGRVVREALKVAGQHGASDKFVLKFAEEDIRTQIALSAFRNPEETATPRQIKVDTAQDERGNPIILKSPSFWEAGGQLYMTGQWGSI